MADGCSAGEVVSLSLACTPAQELALRLRRTSPKPDPREYIQLIESLGHTCISQDQVALYEFAQELARESKSDTSKEDGPIQRYFKLVLSTRSKIDEDPELDHKLVVAASNAISILNYAYACGLIEVNLSDVRDFSYCRIPYANFNTSALPGCVFDHADLSHASFFCTDLCSESFKYANLSHATTYERQLRKRDLLPQNVRWEQIAIARDGSAVAVSLQGANNEVWILNPKTVDIVQKLRPSHNNRVNALSFSPDSQHLAVAYGMRGVNVWDLGTGQVIRTLPHDEIVHTVAYHPDGVHIATGTSGGLVVYWDATHEQARREWVGTRTGGLQNFTRHVYAITISHDGARLVDIASDGTARLRDTGTGEALRQWRIVSPTRTTAAVFSKDGRYVLFADTNMAQIRPTDSDDCEFILNNFDDILKVFDPCASQHDSLWTQCEVRGINLWELSRVLPPRLVPFPDGQYFVTNGGITHVNALTWLGRLPSHAGPELPYHEWRLATHPDSPFVACLKAPTLEVRDSRTLRLIASTTVDALARGVDMSKDGRQVLVYGIDGVDLYDTTSCTHIHSIRDTNRVGALASGLEQHILNGVDSQAVARHMNSEREKIAISINQAKLGAIHSDLSSPRQEADVQSRVSINNETWYKDKGGQSVRFAR